MINQAITITVDSDIAELVIADLKSAPRKFRKLYRERLSALSKDTLRKLQAPAPAVRYPIQWKSEKQRRAFFATRGFGKGIPTKRTGKLQAGWKVIANVDYREGLFTVYNDATTRDYFTGQLIFYEQYVTGEKQQPFHRNTGYIRSQDILSDALIEAETVLIDTWFFVNGAK